MHQLSERPCAALVSFFLLSWQLSGSHQCYRTMLLAQVAASACDCVCVCVLLYLFDTQTFLTVWPSTHTLLIQAPSFPLFLCVCVGVCVRRIRWSVCV